MTLSHTFLIADILFEMYPLVSLRCFGNNLTTPLNNGYDKKICQLNQKDVPSLRGLSTCVILSDYNYHPLCLFFRFMFIHLNLAAHPWA